DYIALGGSDIASKKLANCYPYLGAFDHAPSTFDKDAFNMTAGADMPEDEGNKAFEIALRIGLLQDESKIFPGRVSVTESMVNKLEQFLT
ncbi:MAG: hypothetical protein WCK31_02830, partial [bacterium]